MLNDDQVALQTVYQHHPDMVPRAIVVPIRNNVGDMECIHTLNETAAGLWDLVDGQRTLAEIHQQLLLEYVADSQESQNDLLDWVSSLVQIGALLQVTE